LAQCLAICNPMVQVYLSRHGDIESSDTDGVPTIDVVSTPPLPSPSQPVSLFSQSIVGSFSTAPLSSPMETPSVGGRGIFARAKGFGE